MWHLVIVEDTLADARLYISLRRLLIATILCHAFDSAFSIKI